MTRKVTLAAIAAALALAVPAASADACQNEGKEPAELTVREARGAILCLINQRRAVNGMGRLRSDKRLARAAQGHSSSMDQQNYFSHTSPGGSSPQGRIQSAGYISGASSWGVAENIRWGSRGGGSPKAAVSRWMASPSHRAAILFRRYRQIGVGVAMGSPTPIGNSNAAIYTTTFGYRR